MLCFPIFYNILKTFLTYCRGNGLSFYGRYLFQDDIMEEQNFHIL